MNIEQIAQEAWSEVCKSSSVGESIAEPFLRRCLEKLGGHEAADEIESLRQQLAASQAREQQLLEKVHLALTVNYSREFADNRAAILQEALALPQDTTALDQLKAQVAHEAGEVMRERAIKSVDLTPYRLVADERIRALPSVTLEDLK